ncbi:CBS domain-containing protein [Castellaniella denitrificans]
MPARRNAADRDAVNQNVQGLMGFLREHPPFDQMEPPHVRRLIERMRLRFFEEGQDIASPGDGPAGSWYLIRQGAVEGRRPGPGAAGEPSPGSGTDDSFVLGPADAFPAAALLGGRPTRTRYRALQDTFCLQMDRPDFIEALERSEPFRAFVLRGAGSLLGRLHQLTRQEAATVQGEGYVFDQALASIMARDPVACAPDLPLSQAVRRMHERRVGSIVVTDERRRPVGIFTLRDLRREVAGAAIRLDAPIETVMTRDPVCLPPDATAFDAILLMTRHRIGHLCVAQAGALAGVVSERDLFALQRIGIVHLARAMRQAESAEALGALRADLSRAVAGMLAHGVDALQVLRLIAQMNDHATHRVIELVLRDLGDPGVPFSWLAFGSEGRREQTLLTDQDNGMLFQAASDAEARDRREALRPLAEAINQELDRCGLPLCRGNVMAGNPALRLSAREWERWFADIIRRPTPEHILQAVICFDLRLLWGEDNGFEALSRFLLDQVADCPQFQRMLAETALRNQPPSGGLFEVAGGAWRAGASGFDLKTQALTPFVDAARVLALSNGIADTSTTDRLRALAERGVLNARDVDAYVESYRYLQLLRLRQHQAQIHAGEPASNQILPGALNALDRRILREALRQAADLQKLLRYSYQL